MTDKVQSTMVSNMDACISHYFINCQYFWSWPACLFEVLIESNFGKM